MKNCKKEILSLCTACSLAFSGCLIPTVSAEETGETWYRKFYQDTSIAELLNDIDGNYVMAPGYNESSFDFMTFVITESDITMYAESDYILTIKSESELPEEEINQKIQPYKIVRGECDEKEFEYTLKIKDMKRRKDIFDILVSYNQVNQLEESSEIMSVSNCFMFAPKIKSDLEMDDAAENFGKFGLVIEKCDSDTDGDAKYRYTASVKRFMGENIKDNQYFEELKAFVSDPNVDLDICYFVDKPDSQRYSAVIYQSRTAYDLSGDIYEDGKLDITDLSMLSLYLIGDLLLSENQKINADFNNDGVVNLCDLAVLKQCLSGMDVR